MMKRGLLAGAAVLALSSTLVFAQDAPTSLLPPGFENPAPAPSPTPTPRPRPTASQTPRTPTAAGTPVVQPIPSTRSASPSRTSAPTGPSIDTTGLPSLRELESMSVDELDQLLGLKPKFDIPPASRRSLDAAGLLSRAEGGLPVGALTRQPAAIVDAALTGTRGPLVSRWGHIMLRRALLSRLAAPDGMNPVTFAAKRAALLNRMGEHGAARALVQDIDTADWNDALMAAGMDAYLGTADILGACPAIRLKGIADDDAQASLWQNICYSFSGESSRARANLSQAFRNEAAEPVDVLLAQRFAGAAAKGRRSVNIEWEEVDTLTPWRFALANALGEDVPANLRDSMPLYYQRAAATSPAMPLDQRIGGAGVAAESGILSSAALVDLYSQMAARGGIEGELAATTQNLRDAYILPDAAGRMAAIRAVWDTTGAPDYDRQILTAYAAARMPVSDDLLDNAAPLIASMLTAGLDRDAMRWSAVVSTGSEAWALLALAAPSPSEDVDAGDFDNFYDDDESAGRRKSAFLLAGLAGLGRIEQDAVDDYADDLNARFDAGSRWAQLITRSADAGNSALVAYLAGAGMQGEDWSAMTPRHLYHIVRSLDRVGLSGEARMIAAEAVARG